VNLAQLKTLFVQAGCVRLYAKTLAENDNSKNQVYFGPGFQALNLFPNAGIVPDSSTKNPIFKAKLHFGWLLPNGQVADAPSAQLILYPQYPEVRFSGFLKGCKIAPSDLMAGRIKGRLLFIGVTSDRRILGFVVGSGSEIAAAFQALTLAPTEGVFVELKVDGRPSGDDSRARLLAELRRVNQLGWIDSKQLDSAGNVKPCTAPQCGGFTLEAELGIFKNSDAEPDFLGWEIKQHSVANFNRAESAAAITLMTPEPTGGFYKTSGVEAFVRRFGYMDKSGKDDRMNFGGIHKWGQTQKLTGLTMELLGYDPESRKITDANGSLALISEDGTVAAQWAFDSLLSHWSRKHTRAVYVPSLRREEPVWQYSYGPRVRLAEETDSLRLLNAVASGAVYYDPGIKMENISTTPKVKRRSQFRIASKNISALYGKVEAVDL
jgi:hypothetical protein